MENVSPTDRYRITSATGATVEGRYADVLLAARRWGSHPDDCTIEPMERIEARDRADRAQAVKRGPIRCETCAGSGEIVSHPYGRPEEVVCPKCGGEGGFCHGCQNPSSVPVCESCVPY